MWGGGNLALNNQCYVKTDLENVLSSKTQLKIYLVMKNVSKRGNVKNIKILSNILSPFSSFPSIIITYTGCHGNVSDWVTLFYDEFGEKKTKRFLFYSEKRKNN